MTAIRSLRAASCAFATLAVLFTAAGAGAQQIAPSQGLSLSSDEPVQIDGDRLEMREAEGLAVFDGNVSVVQGDTVMTTGRLVIHYDQSSGSMNSGAATIERLEVSQGVNIQTGDQIATGDAGVYDMVADVFVLTGERVTLTENGNVATGCKLTVTMSDKRARLEGCGTSASRPSVLIQPRSIQGN